MNDISIGVHAYVVFGGSKRKHEFAKISDIENK